MKSTLHMAFSEAYAFMTLTVMASRGMSVATASSVQPSVAKVEEY